MTASPRVLVVDDSLTVRMDLDERFAEAGFEPVPCADLGCARRTLARERFDLVVLDVLLPDGDGIELLAELRRSPEHASTPVVLLSTESEVRHRVRGLSTGADEYVGKPYDPASLVARARDLVRRRSPPLEAGGGREPVLVVDDSVTAREALRELIEEAGHSVVTAASAEEGLRVAADRRPSAVVVDGHLDDMDGAAFVRQLRADAALRTTPCILLTASGAVNELGALDAGADAYVHKEEGHAVVLARLEALLRASRPPEASPAPGLLAPKRIVAIGAGPALAALTDRLRRDGDEVVEAASAEEALALLAVDRIDGVLVAAEDEAAALAACRLLRGDAAWRGVPVLLVGGADRPEHLVEAMGAGADDYVPGASGVEVARARLRAQLRRRTFDVEDRARQEFARSAAILETIADGFLAVDRSWRFVYANHALEALCGAPRESLLGTSLWERCPWLDGAAGDELRRGAAAGTPATFEVQAPGERWIEVRAFPHEAGLSAHLRDVTDRRRAQEMQAHFIGIVGHDLRTPLTAVAASTALVLRDEALPAKHRRALERVAGSASRMRRLINDLLDYSRARLGHGIPVNARDADLGAICVEVLGEIHAAHPDRRIAYRHEGEGRGVWDSDRLEQVLMNLLTNALRHSPEETAVTLAWTGHAPEKVITVHNEGPPIDRELQPLLFEPFVRGDRAGNVWGGVGLGLYIVKQIVTAHGGTVALRSEPGEGTTFTLRLPAAGGGAARQPRR